MFYYFEIISPLKKDRSIILLILVPFIQKLLVLNLIEIGSAIREN